jgi:hypothetical protein
MYGLYAASGNTEFCKEHDAEIVSIAYRIQQYSTNDDCRNEARRLLFRHYCDTNRKAEALQIADSMASIETCLERNIYWALEGDDRISYLTERIADDLRQLTWDICAYATHANISDETKDRLEKLRESIENSVETELSE